MDITWRENTTVKCKRQRDNEKTWTQHAEKTQRSIVKHNGISSKQGMDTTSRKNTTVNCKTQRDIFKTRHGHNMQRKHNGQV